MSKVDPMEFTGLDPKSAVLLAADKEADTESGLGAEEPGVDGLRGFGGLIGSIHRNTLIARQSTVSSLAAQSERNSVRRRRQESYLKSLQQRNPEIGMIGLKRHTLWDPPVSDEILEDPTRINSAQGSLSEHGKRFNGLNHKSSGESVAADNRRHSQSSHHVASHPGSLRSEKISTAQPNTANPPGESESDLKAIEPSSRKSQAISTAGIGNPQGLSTLREHPTGGAPGEPGSSNWTSTPILQSTSPLVRPRQGTTDGQNPLNLIKSGPQNLRSSNTTAGSPSGYERASHKSKERHQIPGKKKFEYDHTELQSLVGPSRSSSVSSSISCSSDLSQSFGTIDQTNPADDSTDQIRIVATHPQLSETPPHLDVVHHYPTPDPRRHRHHRPRHAPDDPRNHPK